MKKTLTKLLLILMVGIMQMQESFAQCPVPIIAANGTSGNARAPIGTQRYERVHYLITAAEMAAAGYAAGTINGIIWTYATAGSIAVTGDLAVYFENTADASNLKSATWATAVATMTNSRPSLSYTLPGTPTLTFDVPITTPFTYTGGNLYVAFEWNNPLNPLSAGTVVSCNNTAVGGTNGLKGAGSSISMPTTLGVSLFRPVTSFRSAGVANDAQPTLIQGLGNMAVGYTTNYVIHANVYNSGLNTLTNLPVTLTISGANAFSDVQIVPSIPSCTNAIVTFTSFTPLSIGSNTVAVTVPADDNNANNSTSYTMKTSKDITSYRYVAPIASGVGFNGATGDFLGKFTAANKYGDSDTINGFEVIFTSTGQPYNVGVWTDVAGSPGTNIYTSSSDLTVQDTVFVSLPDIEVSGSYWIGIRQTGTTNVGFGYQTENPVRSTEFKYTSPTGGVVWTDFSPLANFRIAATVQYKTPQPPSCAVYLSPANASVACQNGTTLNYGSGGGGPTGFRVYFGTNQALVEAEDPGMLVQNTAATSYPTGTLVPGSTYYWRVRAYNLFGDATGCVVLSRSFSTNLASCYCASTATTGTFEHITNVQTGAFSNPSASTLYSNNTSLGVINSVLIGSTFNITVTQPIAEVYNEDFIFVFADFNQDGDFNDVGELCGTKDVTIAGGNVNVVTCTVPISGTLNGNTLLRIKLGDEVSPTAMDNTPCQTTFTYGEVEDYLVNFIVPTVVPNCDAVVTVDATCITSTTLSWTPATGLPMDYRLSLGTAPGLYDILFDQSIGLVTSYTLPTLTPGATYYYLLQPSNIIGDAIGCTEASFVAGASQAVTPNQSVNSFNSSFDGILAPGLVCGFSREDENGDNNGWVVSTLNPRTGNNHMQIDNNPDNTSVKRDWLYTPPVNVVTGKVYRLTWYARIESGALTENYEIWVGGTATSAVMLGSLTNNIANRSTVSLSYVKDSANDYLATATGQVYFAIRATSFANRGSLLIDDLQIKEIPVATVNPLYCTTLNSLYNPIYVVPVLGATNYEYHIVSTTPGENYDYRVLRNNGNPDYRLKWAPGVTYGVAYDVSVKYFKNGIWSPEGGSCPVTLGTFPVIKLRDNPLTPGFCDYTISDLNTVIRTDSVSGANDYQYKIEEEFPGVGYDYNQDWIRGNSNLDFRLAWATSSTVDRVRYGYRYNVQTKALVGKTTTPAFGNRPGTWGIYGSSCMLDLVSASPTTSLVNCATVLTSLDDIFFVTPVSGASDYRFHITAAGYDVTVTRGNANANYRLTWIIGTGNPGVKYGVTYNIEVSAKIGGVFLNYGSVCTIATPPVPTTSLLGVCGATLAPGDFNTQLFCTAIPGATNYAYRITGSMTNGGTQRIFYRQTSANNFYFAWTVQASNLPNLQPNTVYVVEVAYYAGQWEAYGPPCVVTTGAVIPRYSPFDSKGLDAVDAVLNLTVYPNPATFNEQFSIELQGIQASNEKVNVSIFNMIGDRVYRADIITNEEATLTIKPEAKLAAGVYMAEAQLNGNIYRVKFVVN